ncbi:MAG: histidine phosphatase family protein [Massilia sp.]
MQKWPQQIWLVRHGQSAGNVARDAAEAAAMLTIDIAERDMDVALSDLGRQQARALGGWFAALPAEQRPSVLLYSPYLRAHQTAQEILAQLPEDSDRDGSASHHSIIEVPDERLREKEFGIVDRLTPLGIAQRFPELAEQRKHVGKFYFRPPGGESWCDVILRLRSLLETITREYAGERVLIVSHQVIVNCFRYLLERLDEAHILAIDRAADVPNCSVTDYAFDPASGKHGKLVLGKMNFVAPLQETGVAVTAPPDRQAAPRS